MNEDSRERLKAQLSDYGRKLADLTANMVYDNPDLFKDLVALVLSEESPFAQRAARVLSICSLAYPELIMPHRRKIIRQMSSLRNIGVVRSLLKTYAEIPTAYLEFEKPVLTNLCFDLLSSASAPVALKVYSMDILYRISEKIPELRRELYLVIDAQMPYSSAGYKSKGKKLMKKLMRTGL